MAGGVSTSVVVARVGLCGEHFAEKRCRGAADARRPCA